MAVTNNVLNAINVFSSTSVFNSNKGSVGANDLNFIKQTTAELATEGGGIIAQSLGTNGYVKFANGLILQWGDLSRTVASKTFPISFTSVYQVIGGIVDSTYIKSFAPVYISVNSITNTGFTNPDTSGYIGGKRTWIAFGIQQWGYVEGSKRVMTVKFPITFNSQCFTVVGCDAAQSTTDKDGVDLAVYISDFGTTEFRVSISEDRNTVSYVAFGNQQWGDLVNYSRNQIVPFPISFQNSCYCVVITTTRSDGDAYNSWVSAKQNKNFTINFYNTALNTNSASWYSIGFQQWRFNYKAKTSWEVWTFAIPFSNTTYWCYASMQYADSSGNAWGHIYNKTRTGCNMVMDTTTCDYLVIGYQQWGSKIGNNNYAKQTLPISCTKILNATSCASGNHWEYPSCTFDFTTTSLMVAVAQGWDADWLAICIQQWGKVQQKSGNLFPIKFPSTCYGTWSSEQHSNNVEGNTFAFDNVSTAGFTCYNIDRPKYYIALGKQQWGYSPSSRSVTFPISFPSNIFAAVGTPDTNSTSATATGVHSLTLKTMGYVMHGSKGWWVSVGKQQWGQCYGYKSSKLTDFPISFTTTKFIENVGTTYASELLGMPVCSLRFDNSLTTIRTGANNGATSTIGVGTYIVLGIQQWGFKSDTSASGTTNQTGTLNIAFSNTDYALLKDIRCTSTGSGGMYFNAWGSISRTTTSFTYRYPNTTSGWSTYWVAVGR